MDFKQFVNESYLDSGVLEEMNASYSKSGVLKLDGFLKQEVFGEIFRLVGDVRGERVEIADKYSYENLGDLSGVGKLFLSKDFLEFVNSIIGKKVELVGVEIRGFGHRDYTLLHDSVERGGTEFFFVFSDSWGEDWGGQIVYVKIPENHALECVENLEHPKVPNKPRTSVQGETQGLFDTDNLDDGKTFVFPVAGNSFVLIEKIGLGGFVKYVNHLAEEKRFILVFGRVE